MTITSVIDPMTHARGALHWAKQQRFSGVTINADVLEQLIEQRDCYLAILNLLLGVEEDVSSRLLSKFLEGSYQ